MRGRVAAKVLRRISAVAALATSQRARQGELQASLGWKRQTINESEMALFSECMLKCARKLLDTADIVREAIYHQLTSRPARSSRADRRFFPPLCAGTVSCHSAGWS